MAAPQGEPDIVALTSKLPPPLQAQAQSQLGSAIETAKASRQTQESATNLKAQAEQVSDPNERQRLEDEYKKLEKLARKQAKMAQRLESGAWQGAGAGIGIGAATGLGVGTVVGTILGGVTAVPTTLLGGLVGWGTGAVHGPFFKMGLGEGEKGLDEMQKQVANVQKDHSGNMDDVLAKGQNLANGDVGTIMEAGKLGGELQKQLEEAKESGVDLPAMVKEGKIDPVALQTLLANGQLKGLGGEELAQKIEEAQKQGAEIQQMVAEGQIDPQKAQKMLAQSELAGQVPERTVEVAEQAAEVQQMVAEGRIDPQKAQTMLSRSGLSEQIPGNVGDAQKQVKNLRVANQAGHSKSSPKLPQNVEDVQKEVANSQAELQAQTSNLHAQVTTAQNKGINVPAELSGTGNGGEESDSDDGETNEEVRDSRVSQVLLVAKFQPHQFRDDPLTALNVAANSYKSFQYPKPKPKVLKKAQDTEPKTGAQKTDLEKIDPQPAKADDAVSSDANQDTDQGTTVVVDPQSVAGAHQDVNSQEYKDFTMQGLSLVGKAFTRSRKKPEENDKPDEEGSQVEEMSEEEVAQVDGEIAAPAAPGKESSEKKASDRDRKADSKSKRDALPKNTGFSSEDTASTALDDKPPAPKANAAAKKKPPEIEAKVEDSTKDPKPEPKTRRGWFGTKKVDQTAEVKK